ncbi:hypothetical protein FV139_10990 [Parahaliea maris]|uniref:Uncharacterized protein n=1 Tax=Parahaliea maris TaxID=2716870 RepID=A0A5C8ZZT9_9GAMM|nr:hypothetical protein [Parahaliea maris]TXS94123.1 hypothetical protein FV139_10990 [Parahaliea maris]
MFFKAPDDSTAQVTFLTALRHLVFFQVKLGADAIRDLVFSPVSIVVFLLDVIRKPAIEDSLYIKLMWLGRKSDRHINLFDEYKEKGHYTVDEAIESLGRRAFGELGDNATRSGTDRERAE